jgi:hypothetical protein
LIDDKALENDFVAILIATIELLLRRSIQVPVHRSAMRSQPRLNEAEGCTLVRSAILFSSVNRKLAIVNILCQEFTIHSIVHFVVEKTFFR